MVYLQIFWLYRDALSEASFSRTQRRVEGNTSFCWFWPHPIEVWVWNYRLTSDQVLNTSFTGFLSIFVQYMRALMFMMYLEVMSSLEERYNFLLEELMVTGVRLGNLLRKKWQIRPTIKAISSLFAVSLALMCMQMLVNTVVALSFWITSRRAQESSCADKLWIIAQQSYWSIDRSRKSYTSAAREVDFSTYSPE